MRKRYFSGIDAYLARFLCAKAGILTASFTLGLGVSASLANAQETAEQTVERPGVISVLGEGEVRSAPDMAVLNLGVNTDAKTAAAALSANNSAMTKLFAALKADGLGASDMQTSDFQITPHYRSEQAGKGTNQAPVIDSYNVSNSLTLQVRDLAKLGSLIDEAVQLGANQGGAISFTTANPDALFAEARARAVKNAMSRAEGLAAAAHIKLGRIISMNENIIRPQEQPMMMKTMSIGSGMREAVPLAAGENSYRVTVQMHFAIQQ